MANNNYFKTRLGTSCQLFFFNDHSLPSQKFALSQALACKESVSNEIDVAEVSVYRKAPVIFLLGKLDLLGQILEIGEWKEELELTLAS